MSRELSERVEKRYRDALDEVHSMANAAREKLGLPLPSNPEDGPPITLKIISDGYSHNTKIIDEKTGRVLNYVLGVRWHVSAGGAAIANIKLINPPVEVIADEVTYG